MVCRPDGKFCLCLEPLHCDVPGECISFDENVRAFREALGGGDGGRTVRCERAELGHCGKLRYFYFKGDIDRDELRPGFWG